MAQILPPILPGNLYRFRSLGHSRLEKAERIDQEVDSIEQRYIYCSAYTGMNDPMEGYYRPSKTLKVDGEYNQIVREITNSKTSVGIACFTEKLEDTLMWAHYASNYTGICLKYSAQDLVDSLPNNVTLVRVAYVDRPPFLSSHQANNPDNAAIRILSQKQYEWAYEREWRLLGPVGMLRFRRPNPLKAIYLGSRIEKSSSERLLRAAARVNLPVFRMDIDGYDHCWEPLNNWAKGNSAKKPSFKRSRTHPA